MTAFGYGLPDTVNAAPSVPFFEKKLLITPLTSASSRSARNIV